MKEKNFSPELCSNPSRIRKFKKKIAKKLKKLKNLFPVLFLAKTGRYKLREKKNLVQNSVHTRPGQENSEKNSKKFKKTLYGIIFIQSGMI